MPAGDWIETATEQIAREALRAVFSPDDIYDEEIMQVIRAIEATVRRVADEAATVRRVADEAAKEAACTP